VCVTFYTYVRVVTANPGRPSDIGDSGCMKTGRAANGKDMRRCNKCTNWKPERCHHCSDCNQCTLKMDHHCPWVNNCVGFYNYKFFYLLLVYAAFAELYAIGLLGYTLTSRAGQGFGGWDICAIVTIGLVGLFSLATLGLLGFHTHLILANQAHTEKKKSLL
jgi:hypothetical protein